MTDAMVSQFDFQDTKRKAAASRSYRSKVSSTNGTSFTCGDVMVLELPGNVANSYFDFTQCYLKFKITNGDGSAVRPDGGAGAYSLIRNLQLTTAGQTITQLNNYNVLINALFDANVSSNYNRNIAHNMFATSLEGKQYEGESIANGADRVISLPLVLCAPCDTSPQRYWPAFSRDRLQFRFTLEDAKTAFIGDTALENSNISITDVELVYYTIELSGEAQRQVDALTGGVYQLLANDYLHASSTVAKGASSLTATLGFSAASLERVIVTHRVSDNIGDATRPSLGSRSTANLSEWQLIINSEPYPARPIKVNNTDASEALAELMISDHSLKNFGHGANFNSNGATQAGYYNQVDASGGTYGSFLTAVELESMSGKSDRVYSGVPTIGAVVQYNARYENTGTVSGAQVQYVPDNTTVDFYAQRTIACTLDMRNLGTWQIVV
tara:strand:- start:2797 stop:4119 length:1323 start_codon:yes stop_codon:yes gene_type:complete